MYKTEDLLWLQTEREDRIQLEKDIDAHLNKLSNSAKNEPSREELETDDCSRLLAKYGCFSADMTTCTLIFKHIDNVWAEN